MVRSSAHWGGNVRPTARFYELEHAAISLLTHANPRIFIIDEIQHLLSCSAREQRAALNMVKFLSNDRRILIVAAGTHEALHVMRFDPHIASRFEQMELPVWTESDELRRFVAAYLAMLPIRKNPAAGGETTALDIPITVGSMVDLSHGEEMERRIVKFARTGRSDEYIADKLTAEGFRSPMRPRLIVSTVKGIRLRHGILQLARQSHPRQIDGYLTVSQVARSVGVTLHWIYDRIHNGTIALARDARTKLYLFPDKPATLASLRKLKAGKLKLLTFDKKVGS
jgi:hypothetical protein